MKNLHSAGDTIRIKNLTNMGANRKREAGKLTILGNLRGVPLQDAEIGEEFDLRVTGVVEEEVTFDGECFPGDYVMINPADDDLHQSAYMAWAGRCLDHVTTPGTHKVRIRLQTI